MRHLNTTPFALALLLLGCGSEAATPSPSATAVAPLQTQEEPTIDGDEDADRDTDGEEIAGPVVVDPRFELRVLAEGPYTRGEAGRLRVQLEPRGEYEVESRYPYRLVFHPPDGLAFSATELARRDATEVGAARAIFDVAVTPARAGEFECSVDVEFAVCSDIGCVPLERTLAVTLTAS